MTEYEVDLTAEEVVNLDNVGTGGVFSTFFPDLHSKIEQSVTQEGLQEEFHKNLWGMTAFSDCINHQIRNNHEAIQNIFELLQQDKIDKTRLKTIKEEHKSRFTEWTTRQQELSDLALRLGTIPKLLDDIEKKMKKAEKGAQHAGTIAGLSAAKAFHGNTSTTEYVKMIWEVFQAYNELKKPQPKQTQSKKQRKPNK